LSAVEGKHNTLNRAWQSVGKVVPNFPVEIKAARMLSVYYTIALGTLDSAY